MGTAQLLVALMGAGGGGAAILAMISGLFKWWSGASSRERDKNTDLISQRRDAIEARYLAEEQRDDAHARRRIAYEYSSLLRGLMFEAGLPLPAWPDDKDHPETRS